MTAVIEEIEDLELIHFLGGAEDPFERPCEATRMKCPNVALYIARYRPFTDYEPAFKACECMDPQKLCLRCKDWALQNDSPTEPWSCRRCDGLMELVSINPIR